MARFEPRFSSSSRTSRFKPRFSSGEGGLTIEDLQRLSRQSGIEPEKPKVGFWTRFGNVLSAFEPGDEVATFLRTGSAGKALEQYGSEVARGFGSAIPFLDRFTRPEELEQERKGFQEVANLLGVKEEGPWDEIIGIAGDIILDPGNLLMAPVFGKVVKGAGKGTELGASLLSKTKKGEQVVEGAKTIKKGLSQMFIPGYGLPEVYKASKETEYTDALRGAYSTTLTKWKEFAERVGDKDKLRKIVDHIESGGVKRIDDELAEHVTWFRKQMRDIWQEEAKRGLIEGEIPDYVPHIQKAGQGKTAQNTSFFSKPIKEQKTQFAHQRTLQGTISTIKNSLGEEIFYDNPALIGAIREMASKKAITASDYIESVRKGFGLSKEEVNEALKRVAEATGKEAKLANLDEIIVDGEKYIKFKPKGPLRFFPVETKTGSTVAGVTKNVKSFFLPEEIAKDMSKFTHTITNEESINTFLKGFDKLQNLWKKSVTYYFPGFHARNAVANVYANWLGGLNPLKDIGTYMDAAKIQKGADVTFSGMKSKEIKDLAIRHGVLQEGFFSSEFFGKLEDELMSNLADKNMLQRFFGFAGKTGRGVENNARLALFMDQLKKGADPAEAARHVKKYLFDYQDLTLFEKNVMRRIIPFYTWTRKAFPLMAETFIKDPNKFNWTQDVLSNLQTGNLTPEEEAFLPDYIKNSMGIQIGRTKEGPRMLYSLGLPIEALQKGMTGETPLEMMTPFAKIPLEAITKTSTFTRKKIKEDPFYYKTTNAMGKVPGLKQYLQAEEVDGKTIVNPTRFWLLKSAVGRFISTAEHVTKDERTIMEKFVNAFTGVKTVVPDIDTARYFQERDLFEEMALPLRQRGKVKSFERFYIPKE